MLTPLKIKSFQDRLLELLHEVLTKDSIDIIKAQIIINMIERSPSILFNHQEITALNKIVQFCINTSVLNHAYSLKDHRKLALISGAGIAGLAASFELLASGFKVVIAEQRKSFDRFNIINMDVESQRFLKKFGLLNEFEAFVAGRIKLHKYILFEKNGIQNLGSSDVRNLQISNVPFEPEFFNKLFNEDAIYSVRISDLQTFLAKKALESGAHIFGNVAVEILERTQAGGVATVQITGKDNYYPVTTLHPNLFFVAEGAHSSTAIQLGMSAQEVINECSGENWIFGNVRYFGKETFVVSVIDTSQGNVEIANIIFNSKNCTINIAITAQQFLSQELIQKRILEITQRICSLQNIVDRPQELTAVVKQPVHIKNEQRDIYSKDNAFCIGDAAGHSSPLAGMGGTLGLTLIPRTIEQVINDSEKQPQKVHNNFQRFTAGYTSRWIKKSQTVKKHCLSFFNNKCANSQDCATKKVEPILQGSVIK